MNAYWKKHLDAARAEKGIRVWMRTDFKPGDFAKIGKRFYGIVRCNPKTLTVVSGTNITSLEIVTQANVHDAVVGHVWTGKIPCTDVSGTLAAAEARAHQRDVSRTNESAGRPTRTKDSAARSGQRVQASPRDVHGRLACTEAKVAAIDTTPQQGRERIHLHERPAGSSTNS
ncbi:hypothetical protein [Streptomyces sp. NPDC001530]|uniref:hypothetical protein n=1 Tax=Streptomyces sp. NPDC001530 TaxID=3364582 RepID=UPI0036C6984E